MLCDCAAAVNTTLSVGNLQDESNKGIITVVKAGMHFVLLTTAANV